MKARHEDEISLPSVLSKALGLSRYRRALPLHD